MSFQAKYHSATVFTLQREDIEAAWWWIEKFLRKVEAWDWTPDEVKADLLEGKAQLWGSFGEGANPLIKAIWVTRIENTQTKRFGLVWIAAGEGLEEGLKLYQDHTEPWFETQGCEFVQVNGRSGWVKVLKGYEERARVLVKDLRNGH